MLTFFYPWLFILLPLPLLIRFAVPPQHVLRTGVMVPFGRRIREAGRSGEGDSAPAKNTVVLWLIWLLIVAGLARPQWLEPPITRDLPTRDLLLLVDLSGSMKQEDFTSEDGSRVDRLSAVKEVLGEFLEKREGDRVGLVVFGSAPFLQAPFSTDLDLSRQLLDETVIGMAGPRTAFGDAIGLGITLFEQSDVPAKTIIALTDGNDTDSKVPPVEAARVAGARDIRIHTVAIGDPETVGEEKLDEVTLRDVAETTGGSAYFANDRQQLATIYDELDSIETREVEVISFRPRQDLFHWLLLIALFISLGTTVSVLIRQWRSAVPSPQKGRVRVDPLSGRLEVEP